MNGIGGWLLVYLAGAIPVTFFYAAGLAGRFFEYNWGAIVAIFVVFAVPLLLSGYSSSMGMSCMIHR